MTAEKTTNHTKHPAVIDRRYSQEPAERHQPNYP